MEIPTENQSINFDETKTTNDFTKPADVLYTVEEMPEYPGGQLALRNFLSSNLKYPAIAQESAIQGKVYITFVIDVDGSVIDAKIARGVAPSLNKEALRVVNLLPKWTPGKQGGESVKVAYTVPVSFVLQ